MATCSCNVRLGVRVKKYKKGTSQDCIVQPGHLELWPPPRKKTLSCLQGAPSRLRVSAHLLLQVEEAGQAYLGGGDGDGEGLGGGAGEGEGE
eukprot:1066528-Pelagomonas_calceolata.AAC.2